jgi:DNA-binding response OmpR family regulator
MSGRILLVEDDRRFLGVSRQMLELNGYEVRTAVNMESARRSIEGLMPDIIILDINLTDGSGLDLCREIRRNSDVPILFLTGLGTKENILAGLNAGGDEYLKKPVDFNLLVAYIEVLFRRVPRKYTDPPTFSKNGGVSEAKIDCGTFERLTSNLDERERNVARLILLGKTATEMASELRYSSGYVRNLITKVYDKTKTSNRAELKKYFAPVSNPNPTPEI